MDTLFFSACARSLRQHTACGDARADSRPSRGSGWAGSGRGEAALAEENAGDGGGDALGSHRHRARVGVASYQHPSVAYGSGRKPAKVLGMSPANPRRAGACGGRPAVKNAMGERARLVCALHSDRYGLVRAAHSRVYFGQESKSAQSGPCEKSRPDFSLPARRLEFRALYGPLRPCGAGFPSGQARRVRRRARSRIKCSKLKCRISQLWSCRQEA